MTFLPKASSKNWAAGVSAALRLLIVSHAIAQTPGSALEVGKRVADKIIRESRFDFKLVPQKRSSSVQFVDFRREFGATGASVGYAASTILSEKDTTVIFGVSSGSPIRIWINENQAFQKMADFDASFQTLAYDLYQFTDTFLVPLHKGKNPILIKLASDAGDGIFYLCAISADGQQYRGIRYTAEPTASAVTDANWLIVGPFAPSKNKSEGDLAIDQVFPPEQGFQKTYWFSGRFWNWRLPEQTLVLDVVIDSTNSFTKHSYVEWHYANGGTMLGILDLAAETGDKKYADFVQRFCDFTLEHLNYFRWQYQGLHDFSGFNHRIFRRAMLDDTGAPALPFIELYLDGQLPDSRQLLDTMAEYVSEGQVRLQDGTLCRPEPVSMTIWADDLFMSVPFLLRVAQMTGDARYDDDAVLQVERFAHYLFDRKAGLYYHGWFSPTQQNSVAFWGRANGWIAWAMTEALSQLPKTHPGYDRILELFREHMAGLARRQGSSGMWHQVLDHPEFWPETSCTAMFVLAMARSVRNGWLDETYREIALKGWQALTQKIDEDGTVHGICQGTGMGFDLEFYRNRKTRDHDPRGLGAVLTASVEVARLQARTDSQSKNGR